MIIKATVSRAEVERLVLEYVADKLDVQFHAEVRNKAGLSPIFDHDPVRSPAGWFAGFDVEIDIP